VTPEERERLLRLEINFANMVMSSEKLADKVDGLDAKMDTLLEAANMGKGAWLLLLKLGAVIAAVAAAVAWVVDRVVSKHP
jgi:hypothetical protein